MRLVVSQEPLRGEAQALYHRLGHASLSTLSQTITDQEDSSSAQGISSIGQPFPHLFMPDAPLYH